MRLIDADALKKRLQEQQKYGSAQDSRGRAKAIVEVIHAPTIEAEPAIRCEDCKFWGREHISCEGLARCNTGESGIRYRGSRDFYSAGQKMDTEEITDEDTQPF